MAITPTPSRKRTSIDTKAAQAFINGAEKGTDADPPPAGKGGRANKELVSIRLSPAMRARVDEAAEKLGLSRSAWISQAVSRQLDRES
jgi:hypothetical protein